MPKSGISMVIENYDKCLKDINALKGKGEKVVSRTVGDFKKRAPGWVSQEVVKEYNIKKKEISSSNKGTRKAGSIRVAGVKLDEIALVYRGKLLTPVHFGMTPKLRPANGKRYTVKATIRKGQKKSLGSMVFLAGAEKNGAVQIPFQRKGGSRLPIEAVKTVSVPQTITNSKVSEMIYDRISLELGKRLEHNMKQIFKR